MWTTLAESAANERPDHKGIPREAHVRQFLRERLPPKWGVTRGHVFFAGDETTREFDVIVYDAQNCPRWTLGNGEDPRRLVPLEAVIQAGFLDEGNGPVQQPIPYGAMPRLALSWVSTYAKRYKTREIPIGDTASEFLRNMGMDDQGNRYKTLRKQMHALAACRLQLGFKGRTFNGQPVEQFDAWIPDRETHSRALWPGVMLLPPGLADRERASCPIVHAIQARQFSKLRYRPKIVLAPWRASSKNHFCSSVCRSMSSGGRMLQLAAVRSWISHNVMALSLIVLR